MNFFSGLQRAYGQFDKNVAGGLLPGGAQINPKLSGTVLAAQEAVPAILQGTLGLGDRTDKSVHPRIQQGLIQAEANAKRRGAPSVAYEDYDTSTGGGYAAKHTFGRVGFNEFKRDNNGNVTGIVQQYDTDKSANELSQEIQKGGPLYKYAERALANSMPGGITTHNVDFASPTASRPAGTAITGNPALNNAGPATSYAVQAGDTLTSIAAANNTTVADLAKLNNIQDVNMIGVGQKLRF